MGPDDRVASPLPTPADSAASREGRLDRALARASDAPLREGNRLGLLKNGSHTYDDWLAAISRARRWVTFSALARSFSTVPHQPNLGHIGQTVIDRGCAYAACRALQMFVVP